MRISLQSWRQDKILGRVVKNSSYLFASSAIGAVLSIVTANMLGVTLLGVFGVLTSFVSGVNRLFSFRMGDVVVKYMGEALAREEMEKAAVVVKAAMLAEALTSVAAFIFLVLVAPLAAKYLAKDASTAPLFVLYGISVLGNLTTETSLGVLQVTNHYRSQALISLAQSVLVAGLVVVAYVTHGGLLMVLWAYLAGKMVLGLGPIILAFYWLPRVLGPEWMRAPWSLLPPRGELVRFAISTNFSSTINQIARDNEVTWVAFFFNTTVAGYFKTALAIITLIVMPINAFISTSYPEITRAIASRKWLNLRGLLNRVTLIAAGWTGAVALGLLLVGRQVLFQYWRIFGHLVHIYKPEFLPAFPVLLVLLIGFGTANILFWNRPLLLAQGLAGYPLKVSFWAMLVKVALAFILFKGLGMGYLVEAVLLSAYLSISVGLIVWRGLKEIHRSELATRMEGEPV
ncbi:MAG TPA: oligosaccharide flippase family protein [Anaerolineaceae bacterium]